MWQRGTRALTGEPCATLDRSLGCAWPGVRALSGVGGVGAPPCRCASARRSSRSGTSTRCSPRCARKRGRVSVCTTTHGWRPTRVAAAPVLDIGRIDFEGVNVECLHGGSAHGHACTGQAARASRRASTWPSSPSACFLGRRYFPLGTAGTVLGAVHRKQVSAHQIAQAAATMYLPTNANSRV